jgi:O-antigen/teichoic acid export membrane protein
VEVGATIVATFLTSVAIARTIGPQRLGYFNYVYWLTNMTGLIGSMGIPATTGKYMAEYLGGPEKHLVRAIFAKTIRIQLMLASLVALAGVALSFLFAEPGFHLIFALLAISVLPQMVAFIPSQANVARERPSANTRASLAGSLAYVVAVTLTLFFGWDLLGIAGSVLLSRSVELVLKTRSVLDWLRQMPAADLPITLKARMFSFSIQGSVLLLINVVVWDRSDILFLRIFQSDTRQLAFFSVAFSLVEKLLLLPQSLGFAIGTSQLAEYGRDPKRLLRMTSSGVKYLAICAFPLLIGAASLSQEIVGNIYGAQYLRMSQVFAISALFALPRALLLPVDNLLRAAENQRFLLGWNLVCAALNVVLDLALIPSQGAAGAAVANGVAQAIAVLGSWVFAYRRFALDIAFAFFGKLALACSVMAAAVILLSNLVPSSWWALLSAIAAGAAIFILMTRFLSLLADDDRQRLLKLDRYLPARFRFVYSGLVSFLAPAANSMA